ncbi:MAG: HAMP domain-containing protein [Actinobacteria bacterium]|nr:HAMP domain-containing protein [Actinomycetota bacterium]
MGKLRRTPVNQDAKTAGHRHARSIILFQITALLVAVFIASGILSIFFFRDSTDRLARRSKKQLIETEAELMASSHQFIAGIITQIQKLQGVFISDSAEAANEISGSVAEKEITPVQRVSNEVLASLAGEGLLGISTVVVAAPSGYTGVPGNTIILSSNDSYMFTGLPAELAGLTTGGESSSELFESGVPGMGLEGQYLVTSYPFELFQGQTPVWYFDFKPMRKELAEIDGYFSREMIHARLVVELVIVLSIVVLVMIIFLVISYFIRRNIVEPIEELSETAEFIKNGELGARVPVRPGEEFEPLKRAFNEMTAGLRMILGKKGGSGVETGGAGEKSANPEIINRPNAGREKRSSILFKSTVLVIVLFILSSLVSIVTFNITMDSLIDQFKDKTIETEATLIASSRNFIIEQVSMVLKLYDVVAYSPEATREFITSLTTEEESRIQQVGNIVLKTMVSTNFLGLNPIVDVIPSAPPFLDKPLIAFSSDEKYMYREAPDEISRLVSGEQEPVFELFENGVPEMGLENEYLVVAFPFSSGAEGMSVWTVCFKPMYKEIGEINDFYGQEKERTLSILVLLVFGAVIVLIVITFFILSFLIRRKITAPIDELSEAAEEIMEGNLDVKVKVAPGEQFEGLKNTFNDMTESLKRIIEDSSGPQGQ